MIEIIKNEDNLIYYKCDCGVNGRCMIKPLKKKGATVVNIKCAMCEEIDRVVLLQYNSEEEKEEFINNLNESEISWSLVLSNEIV